MDAEDLALRDDDLDVEVLAERPQLTLFELGAQSLQHVERGVHGPPGVLRRGDIFFPVITEDTDPETTQIPTEGLAVEGYRPPHAAGVKAVVPGQRL